DPKKLVNDILKIFELFPPSEAKGNFLFKLSVYVTMNIDLSKEQFNSMIETISKPLKDEIMSTYDIILNEGIEKGRQEGTKAKEVEVVLNGYKNGLSIPILANITQLSENEVIEIIENAKL
ncbi:MAG: hypothetical protein SNJ77_06480, partial [Cytophagales bacterium]